MEVVTPDGSSHKTLRAKGLSLTSEALERLNPDTFKVSSAWHNVRKWAKNFRVSGFRTPCLTIVSL